ncbi:hypothetical protein MCEL_35740 [Mycolicibacterium celeriflavum]|uniref:Uncharacterized protein n=1 Tax=Mycolicibacterium celeriflavum TaxID=1249101 RepID=A0A7I7RN28_MYCCF|nr:hypothetical protein MCEL_35740 [Mycolicibacterium celeriflavum]
MAAAPAHPPSPQGLTCGDAGIKVNMKLIGVLITRHPALYDVLDALIDYGQQRWPSVWRAVERQQRATTT